MSDDIQRPAYQYRATLVRVVDGDTVALNVDLGFRIAFGDLFRLANVDAPELNAPDPAERVRARAAAEYLRQQLDGKALIIRTDKDRREKYGRFLANVYVDGACINDSLVQAGHAVPYSGGAR